MSCCHIFCFVTLRFFCSHPYFIGVAVSLRSQPHLFNPKESSSALPHSVPFFPLHYNHYTTFIRSAKPSSEPRKRNYTPRKKSAITPEAATVLIPLRYTPHSLSATLAPLATASPLTTAAGIALRYRSAALPLPPFSSRLFPLLCFPLYLPRTKNPPMTKY